jgi:hypothetical protein
MRKGDKAIKTRKNTYLIYRDDLTRTSQPRTNWKIELIRYLIIYCFFNVRTTACQVSTNCQIFPIKSMLYVEEGKVENLLGKFDSFV